MDIFLKDIFLLFKHYKHIVMWRNDTGLGVQRPSFVSVPARMSPARHCLGSTHLLSLWGWAKCQPDALSTSQVFRIVTSSVLGERFKDVHHGIRHVCGSAV